MSTVTKFASSLAAMMFLSLPALAQELFIYPSKGQSEEQQGKDQDQCHQWAVKQTGIDPTRPATAQAPPPPPPPPAEAPQGGLLRGAGRGAAVGAVGGAIAGDAGKGAAVGAATGALVGGMRRRDQNARIEQQEKNYQQQQASANAQQSSVTAKQAETYNRAATACLQGRGYTVN
jgi:hypothetical protein